MDNSIEADAIIVGTGITGLVTAYVILERDPNLAVLLIEAENGKHFASALLLTSEGKQRAFSYGRPRLFNQYHENVTWLVNQLQLTTIPVEVNENSSIALNVQGKKENYVEILPSTVYLELKPFLHVIEKLSANIPVWDPWLFPGADFAENNSIELVIQHTLPSQDTTRQWARTIVRELVDQEAHDVSILSFGAFLNACGGWQKILGINPEAINYRIQGGILKIEKKLVKYISEDNLIRHEKIVTIYDESHWIKLITSSKRIYKCRQVILAISPKEVLEIEFKPNPLTDKHRKIFQRFSQIPHSGNTYWLATFSRTFWRTYGNNGHIVVNTDTRQMDFRGSWDASEKNIPALGGLVRCNDSSKGMLERRREVLETLAEIWGSNALLTVDYKEKPFQEIFSNAVTWSPGFGVGQNYGELLRCPWRNIIFAFPCTATCWPGFLDGAIQVGRRSAIEVLYMLRPQTLTFQDFILVSPPNYKKRIRRVAIENNYSKIFNKGSIILVFTLAICAGVVIYKIKNK